MRDRSARSPVRLTEPFSQAVDIAPPQRQIKMTEPFGHTICPACRGEPEEEGHEMVETNAVESATGRDAAARERQAQADPRGRAPRSSSSQGFDAASMGEIAREARVSKGTLYVYFDSKEALFAALIAESKRATAERNLAALDPEEPDVAPRADRLRHRADREGHRARARGAAPDGDRRRRRSFPSVARVFYEAGPAHGARSLTAYFEEQNRRGRLAVPDPATTAWQFAGMCTHSLAVGILAGAEPPHDPERVARFAGNAVDILMRAYAPRD